MLYGTAAKVGQAERVCIAAAVGNTRSGEKTRSVKTRRRRQRLRWSCSQRAAQKPKRSMSARAYNAPRTLFSPGIDDDDDDNNERWRRRAHVPPSKERACEPPLSNLPTVGRRQNNKRANANLCWVRPTTNRRCRRRRNRLHRPPLLPRVSIYPDVPPLPPTGRPWRLARIRLIGSNARA